jgi:hypothetical protein
MSDDQRLFDWQKSIGEAYQTILQQLSEQVPQIVAAVGILLLGLITAYLLRFMARKLTLATEGLILRYTSEQGAPQPAIKSHNRMVGNIVYWCVLLFFITASVKLLGWKIFSNFLSSLLTHLPNLFAGLVIIMLGLLMGSVVRSLVATTAESAALASAEMLARVAQIATVITALVIGIEQLGIDISFFTTIFIVASGVLMSGVALAFGLGARQYVANLIGAQISRKHFQVGQRIRLNDTEGQLLEITQTALVLDTEQGRVVVPACLLQQAVSEIIVDSGGGEDGSLPGNLPHKKEQTDGPS